MSVPPGGCWNCIYWAPIGDKETTSVGDCTNSNTYEGRTLCNHKCVLYQAKYEPKPGETQHRMYPYGGWIP